MKIQSFWEKINNSFDSITVVDIKDIALVTKGIAGVYGYTDFFRLGFWMGEWMIDPSEFTFYVGDTISNVECGLFYFVRGDWGKSLLHGDCSDIAEVFSF